MIGILSTYATIQCLESKEAERRFSRIYFPHLLTIEKSFELVELACSEKPQISCLPRSLLENQDKNLVIRNTLYCSKYIDCQKLSIFSFITIYAIKLCLCNQRMGCIVPCNQRLFGKLVIYKTVVTTIGCFCFTHLLFSFLCQMVKAVVRIAEHPACFEAFPPKTVVELCLPKIHHQGFKSKQRTLLDRRLRFVCFFGLSILLKTILLSSSIANIHCVPFGH